MPGLPIIPEVDYYDAYARQVSKRRRKEGSGGSFTSWNLTNGVKYVPKPHREERNDFYGLNNSMKKLTLNKPRKWRTKENSEPKVAWQTQTNKAEEKRDDDDKLSVASVDRHILRKTRSSMYAKFKYPEKFHRGMRTQHAHLEENIPQCLRAYPRYCNQPVRQDCAYNPLRSVTRTNVHSIKSGALPHPNPNGTSPKKRRPTSAPPGTMTSYDGGNTTFKSNAYGRSNSIRSSISRGNNRPQTAFGSRSQGSSEDINRNGSYDYVYDDEEPEEEGPSHVTLEVIDSDDDPYDFSNVNQDDLQDLSGDEVSREYDAPASCEPPLSARPPSTSRSGGRRSPAGDSYSDDDHHSDKNSDSSSAKSVAYEPDW